MEKEMFWRNIIVITTLILFLGIWLIVFIKEILGAKKFEKNYGNILLEISMPSYERQIKFQTFFTIYFLVMLLWQRDPIIWFYISCFLVFLAMPVGLRKKFQFREQGLCMTSPIKWDDIKSYDWGIHAMGDKDVSLIINLKEKQNGYSSITMLFPYNQMQKISEILKDKIQT